MNRGVGEIDGRYARHVDLPQAKSVIRWPALGDRTSLWFAMLAMTVTIVMLDYRPAGFARGGVDDQRYFDFATEWWAGRTAPGDTHWELRHPLILPILAAFAVGGKSIASFLMVPKAYTVALAGVTGAMLVRHAGTRTAMRAWWRACNLRSRNAACKAGSPLANLRWAGCAYGP